jgi:hypothetical protein
MFLRKSSITLQVHSFGWSRILPVRGSRGEGQLSQLRATG